MADNGRPKGRPSTWPNRLKKARKPGSPWTVVRRYKRYNSADVAVFRLKRTHPDRLGGRFEFYSYQGRVMARFLGV